MPGTAEPLPRAPAPVLRASGLVKQYKRIRAVDGIDLTVGAGERVALLGPERRGQDDDAADAARRRHARRGRVEIVGLPPAPPAQRGRCEQVGFAAGYLPLPERLRVERVPASCSGSSTASTHPKPAVRARARALRHHAISPTPWATSCRRASARSSASSRRRCTARSCSCSTSRPRRSTPTSRCGSAPGSNRLCADEGTALLVTSHNMVEVERLCERVVFVSGGRVVADGTPERGRGALRARRPRGRVPAPRPRSGRSTSTEHRATEEVS